MKKQPTKPKGKWSLTPANFVTLILVIVTTFLFVIRLTGPTNILDNDQERPAAYVLDAAVNHHWISQTDWTGDITSKPPLYTWLAALATVTLGKGEISLLTLYLPCYLAVLGTAVLIFRLGRKRFGWRASAIASLMFVLSPLGMKMVTLARTDPLFAFTITLTATLGYRAWTRGKGWTWFWLAAAASGLTKGPLGLLLASGGFLSYFWPNRAENGKMRVASQSRALPQQTRFWKAIPGILLYLLIVGGWFWMAYRYQGEALVNKMIRSELVDHAVSSSYGIPGQGLILTPLYLLSRFLPWSLLGFLGIYFLFRKPAENVEERNFERFLAAWIIIGCVILGMGAHQRGDLVLPLVPPMALLGGRLMDRWLTVKKPTLKDGLFLQSLIVMSSVVLMFMGAYSRFIFAKQEVVQKSMCIPKIAADFRELGYDKEPMAHWGSPFALQFEMNTMKLELSNEQLISLLNSDIPALISISNEEALTEILPQGTPYRVVFRSYFHKEPLVFVIANSAWSKTQTELNSSSRFF